MEHVVLVDPDDARVGLKAKIDAHLGEGDLHRAFVVLVFNSAGAVLAARRAAQKMLWPLIWDGACASHPRDGEAYAAAGRRRLSEELGFTCPVWEVDKFTYHARYEDVGSEREVCAVLLGTYDGEVRANPDEVDEWAWVPLGELLEDFQSRPPRYAPWFVTALERLLRDGTVSLLADGSVTLLADKSPGALMEAISSLVEPSIRAMLGCRYRSEWQAAMLHQVASGGKKLRPALAVLSCLACGGVPPQVVHAAASLEVLHNATLITDDIVDHGTVRRGLPTTWKEHGLAFAECAALFHTVAVYEGLAMQGRLDLAPLLTDTMKSIVEGELMDILLDVCGREDEPFVARHRPSEVGLVDYEEMITLKTASLLAAACEVGGACAHAGADDLMALREFGAGLGMVFQIQDDILDVYGDADTFGKQIGKDIAEHKRGNAVLLCGLAAMTPEARDHALRLLGTHDQSPEDVLELITLLNEVEARQKAEALGDHYAAAARAALRRLPPNAWTRSLEGFVDYCRSRRH